MDRLTEIQSAIELLRSQLYQLVAEKNGNFGDPVVAECSRRLDDLIIEHEQVKAMMGKERGK
jgi:hypothetical protein